MTAIDALGYLAASLVLATFCAKSMVLLRVLAIASNIVFIAYGFEAGLWPILVLHTTMLPLNLLRLREALRDFSPRHNRWEGRALTMVARHGRCELVLDLSARAHKPSAVLPRAGRLESESVEQTLRISLVKAPPALPRYAVP